MTNDTRIAANTGTAGKQEEKPNSPQESKRAPIIDPIWVIAVLLGVAMYLGKKK